MTHSNGKAHVLLTGVTGFVGKVVLRELVDRADELDIGRIGVLIRPEKRRDGSVRAPADRFRKGVAKAELFRDLPADWARRIHVVAGELEEPLCGVAPEERAALAASVTHVIHCAASIDFDLPIKEAASANITSALNVLELAKEATQLQAMVDVSTCYVTPWREGPIEEELVRLPRPAEELYRDIVEGRRTEDELKRETGHPNTYTYTKCLAEHLLTAQRGNVPLTIVRPSVVSTTWARPFPGWIDSAAAVAGYLLYTGLGLMKAFVADPQTRLDIVPVDEVVRRIVDAAFLRPVARAPEPVRIVQACAGVRNATRMDLSAERVSRYFGARPGVMSKPDLFMGRAEHGFAAKDLIRRKLPMAAFRTVLTLTNDTKGLRQLDKVDDKVTYMNKAFHYFTHHTFDFRSSEPLDVAGFDPAKYVDVMSAGIYRHLLENDESELTLAGEEHKDGRGDVAWMVEKGGDNNWVIRALGLGLRKALRRCTSQVTFDRASFEKAMQARPLDATVVLAPSHRSYFDFLLSSYLCFQHPELGIPVPHIAAAEEFSKIPIVGDLLRGAQAFYIRRGVGQADPQIAQQMQKLASRGESLMFFVEGQRSRSRRTLAPRRGLVRALQSTNTPTWILPISISYDRVPEETAFEKELLGGDKPAMALKPIARWLAALAKGEVQLGRVHIACGEPMLLTPAADAVAASEHIVSEHQRTTALSTFHLRAFLADHKLPGVTVEWLKAAIEERGGRVLESDLGGELGLSSIVSQQLRNQWMHWFYADALRLYPTNWAVRDHVERHAWTELTTAEGAADPRVRHVVDALFENVLLDYALVMKLAAAGPTNPRAVVRDYPTAHSPFVEDAFAALVEREVLASGDFRPGPAYESLAELTRFIDVRHESNSAVEAPAA